MNDRHPLDDAIDRTVRDMTHVAADDDAVARVMARVRGADGRDADTRDASAAAGVRWMLTPRIAWCGIIAILLMALFGRSWYPLRHHAEGQRASVAAPQPSTPQTPPQQQRTPQQTLTPPLAAREFPTRVAAAPSTTRAIAAARMARREALMPASVANGAGDASEQRAQQELTPLESDIQIASIMPAPLGDVPSILVEPLVTSSLTMDEIPVPSIDMPPVSPEQQK